MVYVKRWNKPDDRTLLADDSEDEVDDLILEKKAIPELRFKFDIFVAQNRMHESEKRFMDFYRLNMRVVNNNLKADFESCLIFLFNKLKYMIVEKYGVLDDWKDEFDKVCFNNLVGLKFSRRNYVVNDLLRMENYLDKMMHGLNLTNLLKQETDPFDEFDRW